MTPTKRKLPPMGHWAMIVRTPKGEVVRFYRNRSMCQAVQAAENRADCLDVVRTIEITEAQWEEGVKASDQAKPYKSAVGTAIRHTSSRDSRGLAPRWSRICPATPVSASYTANGGLKPRTLP